MGSGSDAVSRSTAAIGSSPLEPQGGDPGHPDVESRIVAHREQHRHRLGLEPTGHEGEHVERFGVEPVGVIDAQTTGSC